MCHSTAGCDKIGLGGYSWMNDAVTRIEGVVSYLPPEDIDDGPTSTYRGDYGCLKTKKDLLSWGHDDCVGNIPVMCEYVSECKMPPTTTVTTTTPLTTTEALTTPVPTTTSTTTTEDPTTTPPPTTTAPSTTTEEPTSTLEPTTTALQTTTHAPTTTPDDTTTLPPSTTISTRTEKPTNTEEPTSTATPTTTEEEAMTIAQFSSATTFSDPCFEIRHDTQVNSVDNIETTIASTEKECAQRCKALYGCAGAVLIQTTCYLYSDFIFTDAMPIPGIISVRNLCPRTTTDAQGSSPPVPSTLQPTETPTPQPTTTAPLTTTEGPTTPAPTTTTTTTTEDPTTTLPPTSTPEPTTTEEPTTPLDPTTTSLPTTTQALSTTPDDTTTLPPSTTDKATIEEPTTTHTPTSTVSRITTEAPATTSERTTTQAPTTPEDSTSLAPTTTTQPPTTSAEESTTAAPTTQRPVTTTSNAPPTSPPTSTAEPTLALTSTALPTTTPQKTTTAPQTNTKAATTTVKQTTTKAATTTLPPTTSRAKGKGTGAGMSRTPTTSALSELTTEAATSTAKDTTTPLPTSTEGLPTSVVDSDTTSIRKTSSIAVVESTTNVETTPKNFTTSARATTLAAILSTTQPEITSTKAESSTTTRVDTTTETGTTSVEPHTSSMINLEISTVHNTISANSLQNTSLSMSTEGFEATSTQAWASTTKQDDKTSTLDKPTTTEYEQTTSDSETTSATPGTSSTPSTEAMSTYESTTPTPSTEAASSSAPTTPKSSTKGTSTAVTSTAADKATTTVSSGSGQAPSTSTHRGSSLLTNVGASASSTGVSPASTTESPPAISSRMHSTDAASTSTTEKATKTAKTTTIKSFSSSTATSLLAVSPSPSAPPATLIKTDGSDQTTSAADMNQNTVLGIDKATPSIAGPPSGLSPEAIAELEEQLGIDIPPSVEAALGNGSTDSLLELLDDEDVYPSDEAIGTLQASTSVPSDIVDDIDQWQGTQVSTEGKAALEELAGTVVPKDIIDQAEANDTTPLIEWLEEQNINATAANEDALAETLPEHINEEIQDWLDIEQLEEELGIEIPAEVVEALQDGNSSSLIDLLDDNDIVPSDAAVEIIAESGLPDNVAGEVDAWGETQVPEEAKDILEAIAGIPVPKDVIDQAEAGDTEALIDWLNAQNATTPTDDQANALETLLPDPINEAVQDWIDTAQLEEELGIEIPPDVVEAMEEGNSTALIELLDDNDIVPSTEAIQIIEEASLPDNVAGEVEAWGETQVPQEAKDILEVVAGSPVPKDIVDQAEAGDADVLTDWLTEQNATTPTESQAEALETLLPEPIGEAVQVWIDLEQLEEELGIEIPPEVVDAMEQGNSSALIELLDDEDVIPSPEAIDILQGSTLPDHIATEVEAWSETQISDEAKDLLEDVAGSPVPKELIDQAEAGNADPLTEWLGNQSADPTEEQEEALEALLPNPIGQEVDDWADLVDLENELGVEIPDDVEADMEGGNSDSLIELLDEQDVVPSDSAVVIIKDSSLPDSVAEDVEEWAQTQTTEEAKKVLEEVAGEPVPKDTLDKAESGETGPLLEWLDEQGADPTNEQEAALETLLPDAMSQDVQDWADVIDLETELGVQIPPNVEDEINKGNSQPLIDLLDESDKIPSDEAVQIIKDSSMPDTVADELGAWGETQTSPEGKAALEDVAGQPVPKDTLDKAEAGDTAPLTGWLTQQGADPTPEEMAALEANLPKAIFDDLKQWNENGELSNAAVKELEKQLGVTIDPEVKSALDKGDTDPLLNVLDDQDIYPTDVALKNLQDSKNVPNDIVNDVSDWRDTQLSPEAKSALEDLAGSAPPKAILDSTEAGDSKPLTDWLSDNNAHPSPSDMAALQASLPPKLYEDIEAWREGQALSPEAIAELEALLGTTIGPVVKEALDEGDTGPLLNQLDREDLYPTDQALQGIRDSAIIPAQIGEDVSDWRDTQLSPEAKAALNDLAGEVIEKPIFDAAEAGNSWPLTRKLTSLGVKAGPEELADLKIKLPDQLYKDLEEWNKGIDLLSQAAIDELKRLVGLQPHEDFPPGVLEAAQNNDNEPLREWLERDDISTSKNQFNRFEAGQEQWGVPDDLMDEVEDWFEKNLLTGAVKALADFAGRDVVRSVRDQLEEGNLEALQKWLDAEGILPSQSQFMALDARNEAVRLPQELIDKLEEWYEAKGIVFTTTEPPSTMPTTRSLAPGETTTPLYPLTGIAEIVADTLQTIGCAALLGVLGLTLIVYGAVVRDGSVERFLHANQEAALFLGHALVISMRSRTGHHISCKVSSMLMQWFFLADFAFIVGEALQAFAIATNVVPNGGVLTKAQFAVLGWTGSALWTGVSSMVSHHHYVSAWSCWLNLGHRTALSTFVPVAVMAGVALVMVEGAGMRNFGRLPGYSPAQKTASVANQKGLLFMIPLSLSSWFMGLLAVYSANVALYSVVFGLNIALAVSIFAFHTLGNPKVHDKVRGWCGKKAKRLPSKAPPRHRLSLPANKPVVATQKK